MIRLPFYVEGATEAAYVMRVLRSHLAHHGVMVMEAALVSTGRRHRQVRRGGGRHYAPARNELLRLLKTYPTHDVRFTTMFDLYSLYSDFPGMTDGNKLRHLPYERVATLEQAFANDIGDPRFIPHVQLHEFETLLFCDPRQFESIYDDAGQGVQKLIEAAASVESPELIDDGQHTAPSKRIIDVFPQYGANKVRDGVAVASAISLGAIRSQCPHFAQWLETLERLAE